MVTQPQSPIHVFLSYVYEDERLLQELEKHMALLRQSGLISLWHRRQVAPGTNWAKVIDQYIEQASIILLLVSADFLASSYCNEVEMKRALELHAAGQARVIPIIVRPCYWGGASFAHIQELPINARPITRWRDRNEAWTNVVQSIRQILSNDHQFHTTKEFFPLHEAKTSMSLEDTQFYYCYISQKKITQILYEGKLNDTAVLINAEKFRKGAGSLSKVINGKFPNGGEYGKPGTLGLSPEKSVILVNNLLASLYLLENKYNNITKIIESVQKIQPISSGMCFLYRGIFRVSKYDELFISLVSPLTSRMTLGLTCSLEYFSEVQSTGGKLVLSSTNALFFSGEMTLELQCFLYVLQVNNNMILGTPLFLGLSLESYVQL